MVAVVFLIEREYLTVIFLPRLQTARLQTGQMGRVTGDSLKGGERDKLTDHGPARAYAPLPGQVHAHFGLWSDG